MDAAEQARQRRERMQAIQEARQSRNSTPKPVAAQAPAAPATVTVSDELDDEEAEASDPEEIDISAVEATLVTPGVRQRGPVYGPPRPPHMMQQQDRLDFGGMPMGDPFAMLQQMSMGQGGDAFGFGGAGAGPTPMQGPGATQQQSLAAQQTAHTNKLWKAVHLIAMALLVGLLRFDSIPSYGLRTAAKITGGQAEPIFWYFATIQLVLQSLRFFIGGAQVQGSMIATFGAMLPPPYNMYAMILARYSLILTTLRDDVCALLVGLAVRAWLGI